MLSLVSPPIAVQIVVGADKIVARHSACSLKGEPRLEELDRSAGLECHDVEAEFPQPMLDFACVRSVSKHPAAAQHRDQGILARASTRNA
jgi:hypothetical protein